VSYPSSAAAVERVQFLRHLIRQHDGFDPSELVTGGGRGGSRERSAAGKQIPRSAGASPSRIARGDLTTMSNSFSAGN